MESYTQEQSRKTDEELCKEFPRLEPEYTRCGAIVERVMAEFEAEHFKPIVKKLTDHVGEHLWDLLRDNLLSDTELNLQGAMRDRVEKTVEALLTGQTWALEKYVLSSPYGDGQEIRKAVAAHIPAELQDERVKDLERQLEEARETISYLEQT